MASNYLFAECGPGAQQADCVGRNRVFPRRNPPSKKQAKNAARCYQISDLNDSSVTVVTRLLEPTRRMVLLQPLIIALFSMIYRLAMSPAAYTGSLFLPVLLLGKSISGLFEQPTGKPMPVTANNLDTAHYYADHLAEVNRKNEVVTTSDILNENGVLIVAAGTKLGPETALKISRHKLSVPLEMRVALSNSCNVAEDFRNLPTHPEVIEYMQKEVALDLFFRECDNLALYPLILQKLTVLSERLPDVYKKSVLGAYFALLLCLELDMDDKSIHCVFVAALSRDLGLLHIEPSVIERQDLLSVKEWKLLKGHVAIGYHCLNLISNLPKIVPRAVLEHHERTDGLGYPKQKLDGELCREGQIVALADTFIAYFYKYVFDLGYSMRALEPIMQVTACVHRRENTNAVLRAFRPAFKPLQARHNSSSIGPFIDKVLVRVELVEHCFEFLMGFNERLAALHTHVRIRRSKKILACMQGFVKTSGINHEAFVRWLKKVSPQHASDSSILDIEKYALMLNEFSWMLILLYKNSAALVDELETTDIFREQYQQEIAGIQHQMNALSRDIL